MLLYAKIKGVNPSTIKIVAAAGVLMLQKEDVDYVAKLARLEIEEDKKDKFKNDLSEILEYVEELNSAPTGNIEAIDQISDMQNVTRKDEIKESLPIEKVLQNAPEKSGNFIKTKKVFE